MSSMVVVATVDSTYGIFAAAATAATTGSPAGEIILVYPVGANPKGAAQREPAKSADRSTSATSCSARGTQRRRRYARSFPRTVSSRSAPPCT